MSSHTKSIIMEKWREALASVLPISVLVFLICFVFAPVPTGALTGFIVGAALLIIGMGLFTLGTDIAMTPIGEHVGGSITKSKKLWLIALVGFVVGALITISEPDLQVLADQVPGVPNAVIILSVAIGVGLFLVVALLRILFRIKMRVLLFGFYVLVFLLAQFVPSDFLAVAFDSGGVTTGPMTVPFILALGVGVSAMRNDKNAEDDSFGLVALCSIGPILAVMILGFLFSPEDALYHETNIPLTDNSIQLGLLFTSELPKYLKEVALALSPILVFFLLLQFFVLNLSWTATARILIGVAYTYVGLVLFLLGVNAGFMPVGKYIGQVLAEASYSWVLIPLGMIIGYFIVSAEPAVHVLNKQVYELTAGTIPQKALSTSLSIGISVSVGLAMLRILMGIPVMAFLIPGYVIALVMMFFVPPIFTSIAFDSGGVASGPMTATFLLPLAMGACSALGGDIAADAFGVVAMVAMTPLITIQALGLMFRIKQRREENGQAETTDVPGEEIIGMFGGALMRGIGMLLVITKREHEGDYINFLKGQDVVAQFSVPCQGTAGQNILNLLGLEKTEKSLIYALMDDTKGARIMDEMVSEMGINMPGNGIALRIPVGSIGGASSMQYLMEKQNYIIDEVRDMEEIKRQFPYDLIIAIAEKGSVESVMEAARSEGAGGGTIIHARGEGTDFTDKFFGVSFASEKEMILIAARHEDKDRIMRAIMEQAGIRSESHTALFSLPVQDVVGLTSIMNKGEVK